MLPPLTMYFVVICPANRLEIFRYALSTVSAVDNMVEGEVLSSATDKAHVSVPRKNELPDFVRDVTAWAVIRA